MRRFAMTLAVCAHFAFPTEPVRAQGTTFTLKAHAAALTNLVHHLDCMGGQIACTRDAYRELWRTRLGWTDADEIKLAEWVALEDKYDRPTPRTTVGPRLLYPLNTPAAFGILENPARLRLAATEAIDARAYEAELRAVMDSADAAARAAVLAHFKLRFDPWFANEAEPRLKTAVVGIDSLLANPAFTQLLADAARFFEAKIPAQQELIFDIVYLPGPRRGSTATQVRNHSIVEVPEGDRPADRLGVIVHEIAHYLYGEAGYAKHAELANRMSSDPAGASAYNLLNEVLATALGNGLVDKMTLDSAKFGAYFARERSFYNDEAIDRASKAVMPLLAGALVDHSLTLFAPSFIGEYRSVVGRALGTLASSPLVALKELAIFEASDSMRPARDRVTRAIRPGAMYTSPDGQSFARYPRLGGLIMVRTSDLDKLSAVSNVVDGAALAAIRSQASRSAAFVYGIRSGERNAVYVLVAHDALEMNALADRFAGTTDSFDGVKLAQSTERLGPEVRVSPLTADSTISMEPSVAAAGDTIVVAWNDTHGGVVDAAGARKQTGVVIGWASSTDGGRTFHFGGYLPRHATVFGAADSWLGVDATGAFYLQLVTTEGNARTQIELYKMPRTSFGTFTRTAVVSVASDTVEAVDKPSMDVTPQGRVTFAYTALGTNGYSIRTRTSPDGGATWQPEVTVSLSTNRLRLGASVAVRRDDVVVQWMEGDGALSELWEARSSNLGRSFAPPKLRYALRKAVSPPPGYAMGVGPASMISNSAWIGTDHRNAMYSVISEGGENDNSHVLMWNAANAASAPLVVGESAVASNGSRVFPAVAIVDSRPGVLYYDRTHAGGSGATDVYLSLQDSDGSWRDIKITSVATDWSKTPGDRKHAPIQRNFGDYITLASDRTSYIAVWTDGRDGAPAIYARRIFMH